MKKILFILLSHIFCLQLFANTKNTAVFGVSQELPGIIEEEDDAKIVGRFLNAFKKR
ncbi:hypothetical protein [Spirobacillus cienkowskii]|uniref:hypothetical protein n=1 Tax=Spirobacillus cienkowskii TaxID=495820 RepID=UPI0030D127AA